MTRGAESVEARGNSVFFYFLWSATGLLLTLPIGGRIAWGTWSLPFEDEKGIFLLLVAAAYAFASFLVWTYLRYPRVERFSCLFFCSVSVWGVLVFVIAILRLYYSRPFLLLGAFSQVLWSFVGYRLFLDSSRLRFALIPGGVADLLAGLPDCRWEILDEPAFPDVSVDGLAVDLHRESLSPEWIRFIAECSLKRVQIFHAALLYENLTGRVSLEHLGKPLLQDMATSRLHTFLKRPFDLLILGLSFPLWLPLFCMVAVGVCLDMGRPVFFRQERVGRSGKPFSILKFRSLQTEADGTASCTSFGRFIRKHRLDELPQILNVLKGEMSIIGPRPEQTTLAAEYEASIPFYAFRAALRPGITGWAQVCWRYADDSGGNRIKLEHDIFYIKHYSLWLDMLILVKTVETILFGEGSKER